MVTKASPEADIVGLVDAYARRISPAVLHQHAGASVCSPLGVWLLLAACATATSEHERPALEEALGCPTSQAAALLAGFLEVPPAALRTAIALWVRSADRTTPLVEWSASLPPAVERGPIPPQAAADAWTEQQTQGLIAHFPAQLNRFSRLVLASILSTKVSWKTPFAVEAAAKHLRPSSPWNGQIEEVLLDYDYGGDDLTMLADTEAAGVVAVHFAQALEDLGVLSVAADPAVDRQQVFEAAYELARRCRNDTLGLARRSLFDLPVGEGASWLITEREVPTDEPDARLEEFEYVVLPAWKSESVLNLKASALFGAHPALDALLGLIGPSPEGDVTEAVQSAVASFTPTGFEAAAVSAFAISTSRLVPTHRGVERRARLLFDHPFVAIALAGSQSDFLRARARHTDVFCLPLFSAWVETPEEPDARVQ
jgi:hypothetical protein